MALVTKISMTAVSLATVMIIGGGAFLFMNFGAIAKNVTERVASKTLGVSVSIGSLDVDFQNKGVKVSHVKVGNPAGYDGTHAATIDSIYLKAHSLSQALLNFDDVTVNGTEVFLEVKPDGTNLTDIKKRVNAKAAAGDKTAQQIKVIIENMKIETLRVNPRVLLMTAQDLTPIIIPDISLSGIGRKENGVLASEVIAQVFTQIVDRVSREANQAGFYEGLSTDALKDLGVGQVETLKKNIEDNIQGLKGLLEP